MRDPKRIEIVLNRLGKVWKEYPDFRLCQLLANLSYKSGNKNTDLFYYEDTDLLKAIESVIESVIESDLG